MFRTQNKAGDQLNISFEKGSLLINGSPTQISFTNERNGNFIIHTKDEHIAAEVLEVNEAKNKFLIKIANGFYPIELKDDTDILLEYLGMTHLQQVVIKDVKAPMPGLILDILVQVGQEVKKGDPLMILEAMKMENVLKATGEGTITSIVVEKGQSVEKNSILIKF